MRPLSVHVRNTLRLQYFTFKSLREKAEDRTSRDQLPKRLRKVGQRSGIRHIDTSPERECINKRINIRNREISTFLIMTKLLMKIWKLLKDECTLPFYFKET